MLLQNEGKINIFSDIKQQKILNWSAVDILTGNVKGSPSSRRKMITDRNEEYWKWLKHVCGGILW